MNRPPLDEKLIQIKNSSHDFAQMLALLNLLLLFHTLLTFKAKTTVIIGNELCTNKIMLPRMWAFENIHQMRGYCMGFPGMFEQLHT